MIIQSQPIIYTPDLAARLLFTIIFGGGMVLIPGRICARWGSHALGCLCVSYYVSPSMFAVGCG
jgi:hypothetical protein